MNAQRILTLQQLINIFNGSFTYNPNTDAFQVNESSPITKGRRALPTFSVGGESPAQLLGRGGLGAPNNGDWSLGIDGSLLAFSSLTNGPGQGVNALIAKMYRPETPNSILETLSIDVPGGDLDSVNSYDETMAAKVAWAKGANVVSDYSPEKQVTFP